MPYDTQIIAAIALVLLVSGTLKGAIGIGFQAIAIPLLAMLTGVMDAILILPVSLIVLNVWRAFSGGRTILFLRSIGINAYVVPVGSSDPKVKADWIERQIKKGYDTVYFMDDSLKNIKAVDKMLRRYPNVKSITKLIK